MVQHLKKRGWEILYRNQKVFGIEIDILAKKQTSYILLEVKSLSSEFYLEKILSKKQKERLKKVLSYFCEILPDPPVLFLATVNKGKIEFFRID